MKRKKFKVEKEIKAIARERVGSPKPSRAIEQKTVRKRPKHKKTELQQGEDDSSGTGTGMP
jgi:hypothetical protein